MQNKKIVFSMLLCGCLNGVLFAGTANTASLTDIKEAVSLVIKMSDDQKNINATMIKSISALEGGAKTFTQKNEEEKIGIGDLKNNNIAMRDRVQKMEEKINVLENVILQYQNERASEARSVDSTINSADVSRADETITNFIKTKK